VIEKTLPRRLLAGLCGLLLAAAASLAVATAATPDVATVSDYGYPLTDRFVATVVGTPEEYQAVLPETIPFEKRRLVVFPDRKLPDLIWYDQEMLYSVALQKYKAPLIFLIAGTGAAHNGSKNTMMAKAFYNVGFHVVSISSPTYPNFVAAASKTGVPGHAEHDAEDLYRVMEMIWKQLQGKIEVSSFNLTGYSLGAFNAAYVAKLDDERGVFNFRKVLMINSPVSLYNSISLLDRMIDNIPGGPDNFAQFFDDLVQAFSKLYKDEDTVSGDFLYQVYKAMDLHDEQLAALVGTSFRISAGSMVFTSDVLTDFGYVKPRGLQLDRYADLTTYRQVINRLGFTDYYHDFFFPYYRADYPGVSRDKFISEISLEHIADYLRHADKITVMHNADDVILEPGEINFFRDVFGDRATIYPHGGHCGNIDYRDNVLKMVATFTTGEGL